MFVKLQVQGVIDTVATTIDVSSLFWSLSLLKHKTLLNTEVTRWRLQSTLALSWTPLSSSPLSSSPSSTFETKHSTNIMMVSWDKKLSYGTRQAASSRHQSTNLPTLDWGLRRRRVTKRRKDHATSQKYYPLEMILCHQNHRNPRIVLTKQISHPLTLTTSNKPGVRPVLAWLLPALTFTALPFVLISIFESASRDASFCGGSFLCFFGQVEPREKRMIFEWLI